VSLKLLIVIGIGGFLGAILRYLLSGYVHQWARTVDFPYGTLAVNVLGCLLIGFLTVLAESHGVFTPESRAFLFVGLLGSLTTYSTFGNETMNLLRDGESTSALLNVSTHLVLGLGAVWAGRAMAFLLWR
jgi:CrcB protein